MKLLKNKYFLTSIISLLIISLIFAFKGIFPFGSDSVIWSDMHEQVTALYYHLRDAIYDGSLLVNFNSGGAINFLGILAYYILSPFTAIILLFPRDMIPEAVSIIVALKIVLSAVTCLFFVDRYFNKLKTYEKVFLSLLYAFSSYNLVMHIITGWIDIVYLFPLLMVGLKELLELKDKKLYIIILALSLILNYYLTIIVLIFVLIGSGIYLYIFNKKNMKKALLTLGICTLISLLLSAVIVLPAILQTTSSERAGLDLKVILNSNKGPLLDKIALLFTSGPLIALTILLGLNYKKHKKFALFIFPLLLLMGLPILVEPINKIWHLGSYVYFTYRYGFIFIFLLVVAAAYYLERVDNKFEIKKSNLFGLVAACGVVLAIVAALLKRQTIRSAIYKLTYTKNKSAFIIMAALLIITIIAVLLLEIKKSKRNRTIICSISLLVVLLNAYMYFGFYNYDPKLKEQYNTMNELYELKDETEYYNVKEVKRDLISNYGMVTGFRTFSNFTSLTEKNNFRTLQTLGYDSYWMDTESIGGNLFIDTVLGYKYIVTKDEYTSPYYELYKELENIKIYKFKYEMPYAYVVYNHEDSVTTLDDVKNSFEASNLIYSYLTNNLEIFTIEDLNETNELAKDTVIEKEIEVKNKKEVYLELFTEYESSKKTNTYKSFNIYVNGELFYENYPNEDRNGTLDLGIYENTKLNIKIEVLKKVNVRNISVGLLDLDKYEEFINAKHDEVKFDINKGTVTIETTAFTTSTLFVPLPNIGYNSQGLDVQTIFGNFVAIPLNYGLNIIELTYTPKGIVPGLLLTIVGVVLLLLVDRTKKLQKIYKSDVLNNIAYYTYLGIYYLIIFAYIICILAFFISFVHRI